MKIIKYKKGTKGKYSVFLDDGREFIFYEEVILKYDMLLKKEIMSSDLESIQKLNMEYDVYYVALNSIKSRYRSTYDLKESLRKKEYPDDLIDKAIQKLTNQGYLNDESFARSYIHSQMNTTNHGPNRIKNDLLQKKISLSIIENEIVCYTDDIQKEKIDKIIQIRVKSNRTRGGEVLKNKIYNDLIALGFDYELIQASLNNFCFTNSPDLMKREYDKLYKKYSSKYSGYELKRKIREKMYQKGFVYEEE